jgi:hypothetical protein
MSRRGLIAAAFLLAMALAHAGDAPMPRPVEACRKQFKPLRARTEDGTVRLRSYLSTPLFIEHSKEKRRIVVCIYRRAAPSFEFGGDYAEYFDGATPGAGDRIFQDLLPLINDRKVEFVDRDVKVGQTYAYWISTNGKDAPVGPAPVKVRDPRVWWTADELDRRLAALAAAHPERVTLKTYGRTVRGRLIRGTVAGDGKRTVALVGVIHAGESGPELIIPAIERLLAADADLLGEVRIAALPCVNRDERERLARGVPWYIRKNANGVDLNRNFDANWKEVNRMYGLLTDDPDSETYRGPSAASEPETKATVAFLRAVKPDAVFSYHWLASIAGCDFLAPKAAAKDATFAGAARPVVTAYTQGFLTDRRRRAGPGFVCTSGSLPQWVYEKMGSPCFDVEGTRKRRAEHAAATDRTTWKMLAEYQERHDRGLRSVLHGIASRSDKR